MIEKLHSWWDTSCAACLRIRETVYQFIRFFYYLFFFIGAYVIITWMIDSPPYKLHSIHPKSVFIQPGGVASIIADIEKLRQCYGTVTRSLGGGCGNISIIQVPTSLPVGRVVFQSDIPVPATAPEGAVCIGRVSIEYVCDPLDYIFRQFFFYPDVLFTVRSRED